VDTAQRLSCNCFHRGSSRGWWAIREIPDFGLSIANWLPAYETVNPESQIGNRNLAMTYVV